LRALIVPRPEAEPGDHWYAYVADRIETGAVPGLTGAEVRKPRAEDASSAGSLVLVGHEASAEAIATFLSSLQPGHRAAGTLLVAPQTSGQDWHGAGSLRVLLSDDPGHEDAENTWARRGAEVAIRPGGKRFYGDHEVAVLINLSALAMEIAEAGN
jgi:hypothetical protein